MKHLLEKLRARFNAATDKHDAEMPVKPLSIRFGKMRQTHAYGRGRHLVVRKGIGLTQNEGEHRKRRASAGLRPFERAKPQSRSLVVVRETHVHRGGGRPFRSGAVPRDGAPAWRDSAPRARPKANGRAPPFRGAVPARCRSPATSGKWTAPRPPECCRPRGAPATRRRLPTLKVVPAFLPTFPTPLSRTNTHAGRIDVRRPAHSGLCIKNYTGKRSNSCIFLTQKQRLLRQRRAYPNGRRGFRRSCRGRR